MVLLPDASTAVLIDCPMARRQFVIDRLQEWGITTLHVFITHSDADHFGGTVSLLQNCEHVQTLAYNHDMIPSYPRKRTTYRLLRQLMDTRGFETYSPRTSDHWDFQGVDIDVLHPSDKDTKRCFDSGDTNNASVVLRISFAGKRVLLTADVQGRGWQWIVERKTDLQADVLKFPHHGAWYDTTDGYPSLEDVLAQVNPNLVIVSVGTRNPYSHPHANTFALLQKHAQLRFVCTEATSQCHNPLATQGSFRPCAGTVEVVINGDGLRVVPESAAHRKVIESFDQAQCRET